MEVRMSEDFMLMILCFAMFLVFAWFVYQIYKEESRAGKSSIEVIVWPPEYEGDQYMARLLYKYWPLTSLMKTYRFNGVGKTEEEAVANAKHEFKTWKDYEDSIKRYKLNLDKL